MTVSAAWPDWTGLDWYLMSRYIGIPSSAAAPVHRAAPQHRRGNSENWLVLTVLPARRSGLDMTTAGHHGQSHQLPGCLPGHIPPDIFTIILGSWESARNDPRAGCSGDGMPLHSKHYAMHCTRQQVFSRPQLSTDTHKYLVSSLTASHCQPD